MERGTTALNALTQQIIGAAIEVHRTLGPGRLESAYEACLCHELALRQIPYERQPVHEAQILPYLQMGGWPVGLLINFHVPVLKQGIKRIVRGLKE